MHPRFVTPSVFVTLFVLSLVTALHAAEKEELIATAITEYLVSARAVIAANQKLINDPEKGDKGFTPDVYEKQVRAEFLKRTGTDIKSFDPVDDFGTALNAIHRASLDVVAEAQPRINEKGKGFKGFNPAAFGARVGERMKAYSDITIKQTSTHFRATYNRPDDYESRILATFEKEKKDRHAEATTHDGKKYFRSLTPLYIAESCLACHGEPKGEPDVSGHRREGYRLGELRGAISVTIPIK